MITPKPKFVVCSRDSRLATTSGRRTITYYVRIYFQRSLATQLGKTEAQRVKTITGVNDNGVGDWLPCPRYWWQILSKVASSSGASLAATSEKSVTTNWSTCFSVGISWDWSRKSANDRYKDHLDGQSTSDNPTPPSIHAWMLQPPPHPHPHPPILLILHTSQHKHQG